MTTLPATPDSMRPERLPAEAADSDIGVYLRLALERGNNEAIDKLLLLYGSTNRDEAVFEDPQRFDVERTPNDHVAFGFGAHFCLGNSLARLEHKVMFERLLERLPDLQLADDAEPHHRPANFVSGYESMPVRFTPTAKVGA